MRQHAFNWQYGQEPENGFTAQVADVYDAAGNLVSEVQAIFVEEDPEMAPLVDAPSTTPITKRPGTWTRTRRWLMDANQDDDVTQGEMRVFGLGLLAGYVVKSLLR